MEQDKISIVIPVYKTEAYMEQCLSSVQRQTYENLEVLMIDDGSPDGAAKICQSYVDGDSRFHLIRQENQGLGMAKNTGVSHATGKYVCFVDSDDWIHEDYIRILYKNLIQYKADLSMCGYVKYADGTEPKGKHTGGVRLLEKQEMLVDLSTAGAGSKGERIVVSWNKMIATKLMKEIKFPAYLHEDEFVIGDYLLKTSRIVYTDAQLYYYRQRTGSIMRQKADWRHCQVIYAIGRRLEQFADPAYEALWPQMLEAYFENAILWQYILDTKETREKSKKIILPHARMMWRKYHKLLPIRQQLRYLFFLCSQKGYKKKYYETMENGN